MSSDNNLISAISKRRTQYSLGRNVPASPAQIEALIKQAIKLAPSAFNSQSSRAVILFGEESNKLWNIVKETLRKKVPAEKFSATEKKLDSFAAGIGTVLFFEDQDTVAGLQQKFPSYSEHFPVWSEQAAGMAQFAVWSALANTDIGASLQHYNPVIDAEVASTWQIPAEWKLRAQMPFGSNEAPFSEKTFIDDAQRFKVFGI